MRLLAIIPFIIWLTILGSSYSSNPPTYVKDVQPIMKNRCSRCHDYMNERNWQVYENAFKFRDQIKDKMVKKLMPPGEEMSQRERDVIIEWVNGGAKK